MGEVTDGHQISELLQNKEGTSFKLVLHPCEENPKIAVSTNGYASLEGTKEQFRELWNMLQVNFEFEEDEE